jgi:hypothetical protein
MFAYCALSYSHRIEDFNFLTAKAWDTIRLAPMSFETKVCFWAGKALWLVWQLVLPLLLGVSWQHMLFCHAIAEMSGSFYLAIAFQVRAPPISHRRAQATTWGSGFSPPPASPT